MEIPDSRNSSDIIQDIYNESSFFCGATAQAVPLVHSALAFNEPDLLQLLASFLTQTIFHIFLYIVPLADSQSLFLLVPIIIPSWYQSSLIHSQCPAHWDTVTWCNLQYCILCTVLLAQDGTWYATHPSNRARANSSVLRIQIH